MRQDAMPNDVTKVKEESEEQKERSEEEKSWKKRRRLGEELSEEIERL